MNLKFKISICTLIAFFLSTSAFVCTASAQYNQNLWNHNSGQPFPIWTIYTPPSAIPLYRYTPAPVLQHMPMMPAPVQPAIIYDQPMAIQFEASQFELLPMQATPVESFSLASEYPLTPTPTENFQFDPNQSQSQSILSQSEQSQSAPLQSVQMQSEQIQDSYNIIIGEIVSDDNAANNTWVNESEQTPPDPSDDELLLDDQPSQSDADTLASDERNQMEATISKLKESNDEFRRQVEELEFEIANQRESAEKKNAASMKKLEAKMKESKLESNDEFRRQIEALELEIANQRDQRKSAEKKNAASMKKLEAKMKESKMNSARAVARARREAEKAMAALSQLQDRKNSAQLASQPAASQKKAVNKKDSEPKEGDRKTLAQLARMKREKRNSESKSNNVTDAARKDNSSDLMQQQIDRSLSKIERRFKAKIERAQKRDASPEAIQKLESEMKIQIEKMEDRIRSRFKKRN